MNDNYKLGNEYSSAKEQFVSFIIDKKHPCIMAYGLAKNDALQIEEYENLTHSLCIKNLASDLRIFAQKIRRNPSRLRSFVAIFRTPLFLSEYQFEQKLWQLLKRLNERDQENWSENVSSDPKDSNFSFSFGGEGFFVVGMHPNSSRLARQTPSIAIAFNAHRQLEQLKSNGVFQKIKKKIRKNDKALQGSINPMLEDFGTSSEALQYSGRTHSTQWQCPATFKNNL